MSYSNVGKIRQKIENVAGEAKTYDYTYDANGQLTQVMKNGAVVEVYTYDVNGNRTGRTLVTAAAEMSLYDAQDRLTKRGDVSYSFDADGFLTRRGGDIFQYSATGELLKATLADGMVIEYTYDGIGRRVARTVNGQIWQYLYGNPGNPVQITATREPDGTLTGYYYDRDGRLFSFARNGVRYYAACDQVGTPKVVTDAAGNIVKQLEFDSFGCLTNDANPAFYMPVGFAGGLADPDTGLVRFGYRDYDPAAGRWTAKDPIFFAGGQFNLYGYCNSDPVDFVDEDGLFVPLLAGAMALFGWGLALLGTGLLLANGQRPPNMSPPGARRRGAFGEAKRRNNIPVCQQPESTKRPDKYNEQGREYKFPNGKVIRDDAWGHEFPDDPSQNRGPHFNDGKGEKGRHYEY